MSEQCAKTEFTSAWCRMFVALTKNVSVIMQSQRKDNVLNKVDAGASFQILPSRLQGVYLRGVCPSPMVISVIGFFFSRFSFGWGGGATPRVHRCPNRIFQTPGTQHCEIHFPEQKDVIRDEVYQRTEES